VLVNPGHPSPGAHRDWSIRRLPGAAAQRLPDGRDLAAHSPDLVVIQLSSREQIIGRDSHGRSRHPLTWEADQVQSLPKLFFSSVTDIFTITSFNKFPHLVHAG
jgi:hypothetical protein